MYSLEYLYHSKIRHINDYSPNNPLSYGYYCIYCGYRMNYNTNESYFCSCSGWKYQSYDYVENDYQI